MTNTEHLVHQHILEYHSRQKHLDGLFEKAKQASDHLAEDHEIKRSLRQLAEEKSGLESKTKDISAMDVSHWRDETIQKAGPMAVWDILAQKLEDLIEKMEK